MTEHTTHHICLRGLEEGETQCCQCSGHDCDETARDAMLLAKDSEIDKRNHL